MCLKASLHDCTWTGAAVFSPGTASRAWGARPRRFHRDVHQGGAIFPTDFVGANRRRPEPTFKGKCVIGDGLLNCAFGTPFNEAFPK